VDRSKLIARRRTSDEPHEGDASMGWRRGEVWFDVDSLWATEQPAFAFPRGAVELPRFGPAENGLDASRSRRYAAQIARKRRLRTRTAPALALVVGSSVALSTATLRNRLAQNPVPLLEDPPSLSVRVERPRSAQAKPGQEPVPPRIEWHSATSAGLPYAGHLHDGTQLPIEGPDWVTWDPRTDSSPNRPARLYGHERTIRRVVEALAAYRVAHPMAPRVVVGDISLRDGGFMDEHVSHQNGLDVDIYYPRRDGRLRAPTSSEQIDRRLAQHLLDAFVAAGAKIVFVGYGTGLDGPAGVVVPYPNHQGHMHVRFRDPD
jgi:hypothetical protein